MRSRIVLKVVLIFLVSILVGLGIGHQQAKAESKNVWVSPVGTVGTASTTGFPCQGSVQLDRLDGVQRQGSMVGGENVENKKIDESIVVKGKKEICKYG
ncbi:MAG: hypothetical protein BroJett021_46280 [Chloroflexota bacterium]|nr:MAG: hypothetical protein BroJett021_46280 [Chloroflexota bacterium]